MKNLVTQAQKEEMGFTLSHREGCLSFLAKKREEFAVQNPWILEKQIQALFDAYDAIKQIDLFDEDGFERRIKARAEITDRELAFFKRYGIKVYSSLRKILICRV